MGVGLKSPAVKLELDPHLLPFVPPNPNCCEEPRTSRRRQARSRGRTKGTRIRSCPHRSYVCYSSALSSQLGFHGLLIKSQTIAGGNVSKGSRSVNRKQGGASGAFSLLLRCDQALLRWMEAMPRQTRAAPMNWMLVRCSPKNIQPRTAAVTTSQVAMTLAWLAGRSRRPRV